MKNYYVFTLLVLVGLSACTNRPYSSHHKDRCNMEDVRTMAEEAKQKSTQALEEATNARRTADKAAAKADRIYKESQKK